MKSNWKDTRYEVLDESGATARVRVQGNITVQDREIKEFVAQLLTVIPEQGQEFSQKLMASGRVTVRVDVDFDSLTLLRDNNDWCVKYESVLEFYQYLIEVISEGIPL